MEDKTIIEWQEAQAYDPPSCEGRVGDERFHAPCPEVPVWSTVRLIKTSGVAEYPSIRGKRPEGTPYTLIDGATLMYCDEHLPDEARPFIDHGPPCAYCGETGGHHIECEQGEASE